MDNYKLRDLKKEEIAFVTDLFNNLKKFGRTHAKYDKVANIIADKLIDINTELKNEFREICNTLENN